MKHGCYSWFILYPDIYYIQYVKLYECINMFIINTDYFLYIYIHIVFRSGKLWIHSRGLVMVLWNPTNNESSLAFQIKALRAISIMQNFTNKQPKIVYLQNCCMGFCCWGSFLFASFFSPQKKNKTPILGTPHPKKKVGNAYWSHRLFQKISITGAIEEITSKKKRVAWWRGWLMWGGSVDYDYCKYIYIFWLYRTI